MRNQCVIGLSLMLVFLATGSDLTAQTVSQETSKSIGIIDFIVKNSTYGAAECKPHVCTISSEEGGVNLVLSHATMQQDLAENLHYLLRISISGTLFSTKVEVHYLNDPNREVMKIGKRSELIDRSYITEHKVLRNWIELVRKSNPD